MTSREYQELEDLIAHKIYGLVESHPLTKNLSAVALRNMAKSAGWGAMSALTKEELESVGKN